MEGGKVDHKDGNPHFFFFLFLSLTHLHQIPSFRCPFFPSPSFAQVGGLEGIRERSRLAFPFSFFFPASEGWAGGIGRFLHRSFPFFPEKLPFSPLLRGIRGEFFSSSFMGTPFKCSMGEERENQTKHEYSLFFPRRAFLFLETCLSSGDISQRDSKLFPFPFPLPTLFPPFPPPFSYGGTWRGASQTFSLPLFEGPLFFFPCPGKGHDPAESPAFLLFFLPPPSWGKFLSPSGRYWHGAEV